MKSATGGQHSFAQIPKAEIQRSSFNRSSSLKTTMNAGWLIPAWNDEVLPGDTMNMRMDMFARLSTPLHPTMDNMFIDVFWFATPLRLLWEHWPHFNGQQDSPGDSTAYTIPVITPPVGGFVVEELYDYLGVPTEIEGLEISSLFPRCYARIYNEWFRDENLVTPMPDSVSDGPNAASNYALRRSSKRHDYFTSCLPWPSKGDPVTLPLGISAPVSIQPHSGDDKPTFTIDGSERWLGGSGSTDVLWNSTTTAAQNATWDNPALEGIADLTNATAATINQIREAFQIQRLYERDARGGTRLTETIRSHFGIISPDARMQRPEFLGSSTIRVGVHPITQTTQTLSTDPGKIGDQGAYGTAAGSSGFVKSFTEHCIVMCIIRMRADLNYSQGLHKKFSRQDRWEFYWPALAHLGEQAVANREIYAVGDADQDQDADVFGYQERFAEYRYGSSLITGKFRSSYAQSLDTWHLAQDFSSLPTLGRTFIEENPPMDRILAVPTESHLIVDAHFTLTHARPMPTYSVPGMMDHF